MEFKIPESTIVSFVESNFPEAKTTSSGEWHFNNPFEKDGKRRFYINPEKGSWFDQKNQIGGDFSSFVAEYLGISYVEVAMHLIREYSSRTDEIDLKEIIEVKKELEIPEGLHFFSEKSTGVMRGRAAKYLLDRNIDLDGLGYIYDSGSDFHKRVFVPFYEEGRMVYFIARAFDKNPFRYKNPDGIGASEVVYNIDKIEDEVFIFEGVFDALSLKHQVSTCMLSSRLKRVQAIKILDKMPNRITFVLDNDPKPETRRIIEKGLEENIKLLMLHKSPSLHLEIYIYRPPEEYKDFNEYSVATGVDLIQYKDCEKYNPRSVKKLVEGIRWGQ